MRSHASRLRRSRAKLLRCAEHLGTAMRASGAGPARRLVVAGLPLLCTSVELRPSAEPASPKPLNCANWAPDASQPELRTAHRRWARALALKPVLRPKLHAPSCPANANGSTARKCSAPKLRPACTTTAWRARWPSSCTRAGKFSAVRLGPDRVVVLGLAGSPRPSPPGAEVLRAKAPTGLHNDGQCSMPVNLHQSGKFS